MKLHLDGLRLQLLSLIILPFSLLLLVFALAGVHIHQQAMRRMVAERDERAARAAAAAITQQLHHLQAAVHVMALRLGDDVSPQNVLNQASYLDEDFDEGMAIIDVGGEIQASTLPDSLMIERTLRELLVMLEDQQTIFSDPFPGDNRDMMVLVAAQDNNRISVGAFTIDNVMRSTSLGPTLDTESYSAFLTDNSGRLLAIMGVTPVQENLLNHAGVQAALRGETGSSFIPGEDGEHVVAFSPIMPTGWALLIEESWEDVASPILDLSLVAPLALIPALLVTVVALWFGARRVIEPLRRLEQRADKLAKGDYEIVEETVGGIAEIQHLHETLVTMTGRIRIAQQALRGYINTITQTQEEERRRLARELHDVTIQDLIALDQKIQMADISLRSQGLSEHEGLKELHQSTQEVIQRVRRLSRGLRPIYLEDLGLTPALEMLVRDSQEELGIPISFQVVGPTRRLHPDAELALYRMVQETLSNVSRHASADHTWLEVIFEDNSLRITVRDNGEGFQPPAQPSELAHDGHYGLIGMYERAELIHARLEIRSSPGKGTQIAIHLPLELETD